MSEHTNPANPKPPSVDRLSELWRRVNDHKMVQWSVAYVALAYGIQHGVVLTSEAFDWPNAVARISMLLLVLGLPMVMTFAWYHGARASRNFSQAELSILSVLLVIGSLVFYVFVRPSEEVAAGPRPAAQQASVANGTVMPGGISIAVLPFANMSGDAGQEFFSDGMTEEINGALAKVPDLRVVGRTSAFQFKGEKKDLRAIGQSLSARYLIEGSVRKAGAQVRIAAQLVRADDGVQLWAESYDRELTNIFTIQEDIAQAIAASLRVPLGLQQGDILVRNRTSDLESYQQYLHARALVRARGASISQAIAVLEPVVVRNPTYAPAWALLAEAYTLLPFYQSPVLYGGSLDEARRSMQSSFDKAEKAAREAFRLDPRQAGGYVALGDLQSERGKWGAGEDLYKQALALDANDPDVLQRYSLMLADVGRLKDSLSMREKLRTLEPFVPVFNISTAAIMQLNGQGQASIPILETISPDSSGGVIRNVRLARAYAAAGRYAEAADTLLLITENQVSRKSVEDAARLLRRAPAKAAEPLPKLEDEMNFVYAYVGAPDRALDNAERSIEIGDANSNASLSLWLPLNAPLRKTERFNRTDPIDGSVSGHQAVGIRQHRPSGRIIGTARDKRFENGDRIADSAGAHQRPCPEILLIGFQVVGAVGAVHIIKAGACRAPASRLAALTGCRRPGRGCSSM